MSIVLAEVLSCTEVAGVYVWAMSYKRRLRLQLHLWLLALCDPRLTLCEQVSRIAEDILRQLIFAPCIACPKVVAQSISALLPSIYMLPYVGICWLVDSSSFLKPHLTTPGSRQGRHLTQYTTKISTRPRKNNTV